MENGVFTTIEDLKKERERLKILNQVTRQELSDSMLSMQGEAKAMVLKNVAIPLGIAGLGVAAAKVLKEDEDEAEHYYARSRHHEEQQEASATSKGLLLSLVPIGLAILKEYLVAEADDSDNEEQEDENVRYTLHEELK